MAVVPGEAFGVKSYALTGWGPSADNASKKLKSLVIVGCFCFMRPNDTVPPSSDERLFWIAINGPSCAIASHPATETLKVQPVPEVLLWFNTYEEAVENRHFILTA